MYRNCFLIVLTAIGTCCANTENVLKFLVIGDWGGRSKPPYYTPVQLNVAEQMGVKAEEIGANFTVAVGDNFYSSGVKNVDDPRFQDTFEVSIYKYIHNDI